MHELSLAVNIVDIALKHANEANAKRIVEIEVGLGALSCVTIDALEFCCEAVCKGTMAEGSKLSVRERLACGDCDECKGKFEVDSYFSKCPHCGSSSVTLTDGKGLTVLSVTVD